MKFPTKLLAPVFTMIALGTLSSCSPSASQIKKVLKNNPDVLVEAIKEHPADIILALNEASRHAQEEMGKKREEDEKKELEASFTNPLVPEMRSDESIRGPKDAPLTLIEYSDFQCPYCKKGYDTVHEVLKKYDGKIRFVYKHLPLVDLHPMAMPTARYYEAIRLQDEKKAFKFHDAIFENQAKLRDGEKYLKEVAKGLGVNMGKLEKDIDSDEVKARITADSKEAEKFGMTGTPGFVFNGVPIRGAYPPAYFDTVVEELKKRGKLSI